MQAAHALRQNRLDVAEPLLKTHLKADPFDVAAIRMLAELAARIDRAPDAEKLLRRALDLAPEFSAARVNLATILYRTNRAPEALAQLDRLNVEREADAPGEGAINGGNANLRAAVLNRLGEFEAAMALYEDMLSRFPGHARVWMSYGHVLKTVGRLADAVEAYRRAVGIEASFGEAWWSLANLKTVKLDEADRRTMEQALTRTDLAAEDRFHLEFALGKAWEDAGDHDKAFAAYRDANAHRRALIHYDAAETTGRVDRMIQTFTPTFFADRAGQGCPALDPIFILGLPRAGSTLVEQILASHSQIEAIAELPDIPDLWASLAGADGTGNPHERLAALNADEIAALGEAYLRRVSPQRRTDRPFFIDKLPNNWLYTGFIRTILPNARIVDVRRHPLSAGVANFRQHFARGQHFAYDLADLGHYYRDYVRMMAQMDAVLPGAVHLVRYEALVEESESQIRALLAALGLPFEEACLAFHETKRPVRTPSSEQVRSPIFRQGTENWQAYDRWLGPLRDALGDLVQD
ncbi:MAG: sulfotransferase [Sphingomonadales bacterium]|nr:sulfotransferase [Sphingomonadales bacterium]MDE2167964.1 sulfotransferase [Sphingomonadales bacterium]